MTRAIQSIGAVGLLILAGAIPARAQSVDYQAVSYTHLDVYKRQGSGSQQRGDMSLCRGQQHASSTHRIEVQNGSAFLGSSQVRTVIARRFNHGVEKPREPLMLAAKGRSGKHVETIQPDRYPGQLGIGSRHLQQAFQII